MKKLSPRSQAAFSLVEVALALGIAAFCLVSIFGLIPVGVNTSIASFEQTGAANIASAVAADLRTTVQTSPPTDQKTPYYGVTIPGSASGVTTFYVRQDGALTGTINANAIPAQAPHYRVTLYFTTAGTATSAQVGNPNATSVRILVTWPALADAAANKPPSGYAGSFESFAGLVVNN